MRLPVSTDEASQHVFYLLILQHCYARWTTGFHQNSFAPEKAAFAKYGSGPTDFEFGEMFLLVGISLTVL